ncbi:MAG: YebC/PmpR family DNA-binding transcriptional regulator [Clostridia bacterium]|nr:YebC/PmpR family DNA-binding transcriptional regulator [Clostridia bacterium]MBR2735548.1 YebC/PmpR family DNA-binding transcriptional regulator [Clostridia bacterium]
MSGHSKWNNIKRKKEKTDAQRAKIFTKIGRELAVAVKEGGADPNVNSKLKDAIAKAKSNNVPNDNIERIIKKAAGGDGNDYEEITYEGYGPSGVAIIIETLTDNRNRTAGNIRHYFSKYGGNMGSTGCVSFMFKEKGIIVVDAEDIDESKIEEDAIEAGAGDFIVDDDCYVIYTDKEDYSSVHNYLEEKGYTFVSSEIGMVPDNYVTLPDEEAEKVNVLLDILDEDEDIKNVWHNLK